jgi:inosine/xanthosine triphosphate pyrophosphatase family protein
MSKIERYSFLTSNVKKASDFKKFGFGVKNFDKEIKEIKSPHTDIISLYKAKDTGLTNIIVEDTGLYVEGANFCGSEIKYVYEHIKDDDAYHGSSARWVVAICLKTETEYLVAQGITEGVLSYPASKEGYHFERIFAVNINGKNKLFSELNEEERTAHNPRYKALEILKRAVEHENYLNLFRVPVNRIHEWIGEYQEDTLPKREMVRRSKKKQ